MMPPSAESFESRTGIPEIGGTVPEMIERSSKLFGKLPVFRQKKVVILLPPPLVTGQRVAAAPERAFSGRRPVGRSGPKDPPVDQIGFQVHDVPAGVPFDTDLDARRLPEKP